MKIKVIGLMIALYLATPAVAEVDTPSHLFGQLFVDVQMQRVFPDGKTFVDALPNDAPVAIVQRYEEERGRPGFDLSTFVHQNFTVPPRERSAYRSDLSEDVCRHIDNLWQVLERRPDSVTLSPYSSLLPLPRPYVVPGGRFDEIYYWDSYFTMLGLEESGRHDLAVSMVENFVSLVDRYGHIPNGNRSYFLSRSQPPFFASMVELIAVRSRDPATIYAAFLPALSKEYAFWMEGADMLEPGNAHRRVVRLDDGTLLNRYWDDRDSPRDESYREDVETARASNRPAAEVYRDLRAAAESGWDFSSRWLADGKSLATINTTALVPVDLNSLLFHLETILAQAYAASQKPEKAAEFRARAALRKAAVQRYLWDAREGMFTDYLWRENKPTGKVTAAGLSPLFFGLATQAQADRVAQVVRSRLLKPGGLVATTVQSGQQWDAPNGWAPLQWIAIEGLRAYGKRALAQTIARRWIGRVVTAYRNTGKLMEKYNVVNPSLMAGGGEYPGQDGFGWTNGVVRKLLVIEDGLAAGTRCASPVANDNLPSGLPWPGRSLKAAP
ncbi:alpha,alpha-trehalase TreF [Microvirga calopogonii]|uniref:alpha,alpha-trehalase TreF n=1 Tax=Microvirga calopogonii TaxID=2078013 RepID=UPI000E0D6DD0|nr:alpha,alpha-trehalase TreF [Microvirga calopogonii]